MTNKKHPLDKPMPCPVCGELVGPSHYTDGELRGDGTQANAEIAIQILKAKILLIASGAITA